MSGCCSPGSPDRAAAVVEERAPDRRPGPGWSPDAGLRLLPLRGGSFAMGSEDDEVVPGNGEGPVRDVVVEPYAIDAHCVSNERFAAFVEATGHVTDAERFDWSFVFDAFVPADLRGCDRAAEAPWWAAVPGACWHSPEGPGSDVSSRADHPVVHISWNDARAYCYWSGTRLPSEAEWEYAARGGLRQARFPWGDDLHPDGRHACNIWQGSFPTTNTLEDGFFGTAPVDAFEPNGHGLFNVAGNVWEWTADTWSVGSAVDHGSRVIRGGSYLCHASYCNRYRVSARTSSTPHSSTGHQGFRVAL
jgi:formylglycine-generating enzyme required for sulfatase activity